MSLVRRGNSRDVAPIIPLLIPGRMSVILERKIAYLSGDKMREIDHEVLELLDEDSDPTVATMNNELLQDVLNMAGEMVASMFQIDLELEKCRKALSLLQPSRAGRLDMRYWSHKTIPGKHPQLIRWKLLKRGQQPLLRGVKRKRVAKSEHSPMAARWSGEKLPHKGMTKMALKSKGFQDTHEFVVEVLRITQGLLELRAAVVKRLGLIRSSSRGEQVRYRAGSRPAGVGKEGFEPDLLRREVSRRRKGGGA